MTKLKEEWNMEEIWLDNMMEKTTTIKATVEELFAFSEDIYKLDLLSAILDLKGNEYSIYASELKHVVDHIETLTDRIRYSFNYSDEKAES